jgi:phospholipid/cholesterol/gamma-HCH transport system substrate-binding protein
METRANYVLVGSCVLAAIASILIFIFWLGRSELSHKESTYYTYFTGSVAGLINGGPVRYRGVSIGKIGNIEIDPQNVERIRVTLLLKADAPIKTDTIASLEMAGITGGSYVELTGGTQSSPPLEPKQPGDIPVIQSENSSLQSLVDDAPKLLGKLNQLADNANNILSPDNAKKLSETIDHLNSLAANLDGLGPDARQAVANINGITGNVNKQLPQIMDSLHQDTASVRQAADGFNKVAADLDGILAENRAPLRDFTGNGLSEITSLVSNLRTLTETLNRVADRLDRDPQRYLFGGNGNGVDPNHPFASGISAGESK